MTEVDFPEQFLFALKWTTRAQNGFFLSFHKILSLIVAGSNLKWKTLQFSVFLCKPNILENSASEFLRSKCPHPFRLQDSWIVWILRYSPKRSSIWDLLLGGVPTQICLDLLKVALGSFGGITRLKGINKRLIDF